ncbi:MAG: LuxR C-terminal-related transcriptional regulator [Alphaproteobacteria bacterium]
MRVLVADDHALFRQGLRLILGELDDAVETVEAGNFPDAVARAEDSGPFDLVLLDLGMPGMPPFEGLAALCRRLPEVPVVVLSASERPSDVSRAIDTGARGYILKSSRPEVLCHALPLVLAGELYVPPVMLAGREAPAVSALPGNDDAIGKLTPRERDVLSHLVAGRSNKQIAQELAIDEGTVKAHLKALMRKLEVANRTQAAMLAVREGWVEADGDQA